jgi:hypothetical protein
MQQKPFIKIQIKGALSVSALVASGIPKNDDVSERWLTFIAFSSEMKVNVMNYMAENPNKTIRLSVVDEAKTGEWYED